MALTARSRTLTALAAVGLAVAALVLRLAAAPGADLDPTLQELLGRAPRLDAYWYTRAAVDEARGTSPAGVTDVFDRPLYTLACRACFAITGVSERTLPLPAMIAAALGVAALVLAGTSGGLGGAAILAGAFAVTNWLAVVHDREPLIYSTVNLVFLLSLLAWVRGLRERRWLVVAWAGFAATFLWGKETVVLALPALLAGHLMARGDRRARLRTAGALLLSLAVAAVAIWLLAPSLARDLATKIATRVSFTEIPFPGGWVTALGDLPSTLAVIDRIPAVAVLTALGIAAVLLEGRADPPDDAQLFRRFLVLWLVVGCAGAAGFAYHPTRYVLGLFPPAFLLSAHAAGVLWGTTASPVRAGHPARVAILGLVWWIGLSALYSWLLALLPATARIALPAALTLPAVRLGVAAAAATALALRQADTLGEAGRLRPARRYALALVAFVFLTDARALSAHLRPVHYDDVAARRSFEAVVGPGAVVRGYAAHYLAFSERYRVVTDFRIDPASIVENPNGATHLATLWVPELDYVERLLAAGEAPLHRVADVEIGRERYRVYRLNDAGRRGYSPTPFERARTCEESGDAAGARAIYREILRGGATDPLVLAWAGAALAESAPGEALGLLRRAREEAPRNGLIVLRAADAAAAAGRSLEAVSLRARAAGLLPHELVLGFGLQPRFPTPQR